MTLCELPPKVTPLTYASVINALMLAWECTGTQPSKAGVRLAAAQIAIESGLRSCMNFNVSGIKSRPNNGKTCWQYFKTSEYFTGTQAAVQMKLGPMVATDTYDGARRKYWVNPRHPACCFRAFESLDDAMRDHLHYLQANYAEAWTALCAGNVANFAHGLRLRGYFTAPERDYLAGARFRMAQEIAAVGDTDAVWGDVT